MIFTADRWSTCDASSLRNQDRCRLEYAQMWPSASARAAARSVLSSSAIAVPVDAATRTNLRYPCVCDVMLRRSSGQRACSTWRRLVQRRDGLARVPSQPVPVCGALLAHTVSSGTPGRQFISPCPTRIDPGLSTAEGVNGQVFVPAGGQVKVPTPRVDQVLFRVVPFLALASRMR